jgi:hypothetical protein
MKKWIGNFVIKKKTTVVYSNNAFAFHSAGTDDGEGAQRGEKR